MNNIVEISGAMHRITLDALPHIYETLRKLSPKAGDYKMSARSNDFEGWILCDGRALDRSAYSNLFDVIGTSFGSTASNTFRLPDYRGRVIGQPGSAPGLTSRILGTAVGTETHVLTANEMPSHTHTATASNNGSHTHSINDPGHTHSQTTINDDFNNSGENPPGFTADSSGTMTWNNINSATTGIVVEASGVHSHNITVDSAGLGLAHNNMQPTLFGANVFIFTGI